jgi:hypothetical protein
MLLLGRVGEFYSVRDLSMGCPLGGVVLENGNRDRPTSLDLATDATTVLVLHVTDLSGTLNNLVKLA